MSGKVGTKFRAQSVGGGMRGSSGGQETGMGLGVLLCPHLPSAGPPAQAPGREKGMDWELANNKLELGQKPKLGGASAAALKSPCLTICQSQPLALGRVHSQEQ